jgi:hypothetical protein
MVIEFKVSNFRSIKDEAILSMVAEPSKSKSMNYWEQPLAGSSPVRLLKIAAIYGANASGKSNLLAAFRNLFMMLDAPPKGGSGIPEYEPFSFDLDTQDAPTRFDLTFVGTQNVKYRYLIEFDSKIIREELLEYYPTGNKRTCFHRLNKNPEELVNTAQMGSDFRNKKIKIFSNQLLLAKFGGEEPDEVLSRLYLYLKTILVVNASVDMAFKTIRKDLIERFNNDKEIHANLDLLIEAADIKIKGTKIIERNEEDYQFPNDFPEEEKAKIINDHRFQVFGQHDIYQNNEVVGMADLNLEEESQGTNALFMLGGLILLKLKEGGTIFVDELDTSLHPDLVRMLVQLFQMETTNPKNAQLVFTTHDTNLMDSALLRKDQVWFAEKDEYGATDFFSLQDFDSVRETTPFEKWYGAGKFGAKPNISDLAF